jgi:hypothetical protein
MQAGHSSGVADIAQRLEQAHLEIGSAVRGHGFFESHGFAGRQTVAVCVPAASVKHCCRLLSRPVYITTRVGSLGVMV